MLFSASQAAAHHSLRQKRDVNANAKRATLQTVREEDEDGNAPEMIIDTKTGKPH